MSKSVREIYSYHSNPNMVKTSDTGTWEEKGRKTEKEEIKHHNNIKRGWGWTDNTQGESLLAHSQRLNTIIPYGSPSNTRNNT